ncbi:MAG: hypothetical protein GTN53_22900 [Candidatus Aminicenantes bacterium]|nr:hypothetical protein [Candidatus Aminicenantes bacterium]NIQ69354.1 hypothetical protein [Candidatus Aminicenantes bacterium]NIT25354.1 hypothetical protein [Candidatus Aminicenantes bacterium]
MKFLPKWTAGDQMRYNINQISRAFQSVAPTAKQAARNIYLFSWLIKIAYKNLNKKCKAPRIIYL